MCDSQQRRGFVAPRAWPGDITGTAIAALSDVAEARQKPAVASSYRDATPDAAIVSALAHGALAASGGGLVDETAIAAAPAGMGPALAAHLPAGAEPDAVRDWFELETIVDLPAPALSFAEAEAAAADYRRAARADNTRRAYRAGVAAFTEWCAVHAQAALPALPETIAAFLAAEAGRGLAVNTLRLRHAALRYLHLLAGYPPPTASPLVSATFAGIRRAHRRPLRKKTAQLAGTARPCLAARRLCRGACELAALTIEQCH
jgi:hypothetical protein